MTFNNIAALFGAMVILATIPSLSVFTTIASSISSGFTRGLMTVMGIVVGDIIFILIAIYGLSAIAQTTMNSLLVLIKCLGGAYLICFGVNLARSQPLWTTVEAKKESFLWASFLNGLLLTLGDPKAIFFYVSFFPAFVDLNNLTILDTAIVVLVAIVAVGGVKAGYAYVADRARLLLKNFRIRKVINLSAATLAIGTGIFLIAKH